MGNSPTYDELMNATAYSVAMTETGENVFLTKRGTTYAETIEEQELYLHIHLQSGYQPTIYTRNSGSEWVTILHYEDNEQTKKIIDFACRMATKDSKYDYSIDDSGNYPLVVRA